MNYKLFCFSLFIFNFSLCLAQDIPNKGFEDWSYYKGSGFEVPTRWITNDVLTAKINPKYKGISTSKTSDAHSGNYAVKMQVVIDHGETVNGCIYSIGSVDSLIFFYQGRSNAGFRYGEHATTLNGFYKFNSVLGDSAIFGVTLTRWNKEKNQRDTLVNSVFIAGHDAPQYAPFVIPFKYRINNELPDTALIVIGIQAGQGKSAHVGTTFYIDDVEFGGRMPMKR
ncbi:MAG: hypothetical protein ACLQQ4_07810 [Bacteroidia bacterium]